MLFLRETHELIGERERDFEVCFRDAWMPALAATPGARLLYYLRHAHGTGPSYHVITWTAIQDGVAWHELVRRVDAGDLRASARALDELRHDVTAKLFVPLPWSPLQALDLAGLTTAAAEHEPTLFMEDTGWPDASLDEYLAFWEDDYHPMLARQPEATRLLEIQVCWVTALGAGLRPEAILWQRVHSHEALLALLTTEVPSALKGPGSYMAKALELRDQWRSRLLRTSSWSPRW